MSAADVHNALHDFAWFIIGAAFGANLIAGIVLWYRRPPRRRKPATSIELPGLIVEFRETLTDEQAAEWKRRWTEAFGKRPRIDSPGSDVQGDQTPGVDAAGGRTAGGRGIHGRTHGAGNDNHERH